MKAIVAVEKNWGIGKDGKLLTHIPNDLKFFKEKTTGKAVIMGRKTFESLPKKQPLPNRHNIILTRDKNYSVEGTVVLNSIDDILDYVKNFRSDDIFVIGGGEIYREFMPFVDEIYVTKIDYNFSSDTYFENLDKDDTWKIVEKSEEQTYFDICYHWIKYKKIYEEEKRCLRKIGV